MSLQTFTNSSFAFDIVLAVGKLQPKIGYPIAQMLADLVAGRKNSALVKVVQANQWVVHDQNLSGDELDQAVRAVFRHSGKCYYELYRSINHPEQIKSLAPYNTAGENIIRWSQPDSPGALVVGPHLSNFDLVLFSLALRGLHCCGLAPARLPGGYKMQNRIRESMGIEIESISTKSLHRAIQTMRNGGLVFTGVDRPVEGDNQTLEFFGRPANLPTGPVRLAMKAKVPVIVAAAQMHIDGKYHLVTSDPIEMITNGHREQNIIANAEMVLQTVEEFIRQTPQQWLMFFPLWAKDIEELL